MVLVSDGIKLRYSFHCSVYHTFCSRRTRFRHLACARASSQADPTTIHLNPRALRNNGAFLTKTPKSNTDARDLYSTHSQDRIYTHKALINVLDYESQNLILLPASIKENLKRVTHHL